MTRVIIAARREQVISLTCDACGKTFDDQTMGGVIEKQEAMTIRLTGGYGSIFGDGYTIAADLCQHCLKLRLGDILKVEAPVDITVGKTHSRFSW